MNERIPCSVPVLTLNCKAHLERLLPTLLKTCDDVFLVDGNSTDGTLQYAKQLGVRVERQFDTDAPNQRIQDFAVMRRKSWEMARYDWIFVFDADEIPSDAMMERLRRAVQENNLKQAYRFSRLVRLPDGRVIQHAFFYPDYGVIRLFHRSSGVTLMDRRVHERFVIPDDVTVVDCPETFTNGWPTVEEYRKKSLYYLSLEWSSIDSTLWTLWRFVVWYQVRSFLGQLLRSVNASLRAAWRGESCLPWGYTMVMLEYRFRSMAAGWRAWKRARQGRVS